MLNSKHIIALIGCGKMGGAMLRGWLDADIDAHYIIIEPYGQPDFTKNNPRVTYAAKAQDAKDQLGKTDLCILAVKPQIMSDICAELSPHIKTDCLILSVAAGQTIANFEDYFSPQHPVIRVTPNTPAAIGKGMSVAAANANVTADQKALTTQLLTCSGRTEWIDDESLMNAVTAVSGSGPAYVFYVIEALASAGENVGLTPDTAMTLARQTVIGAAALAEAEADTPASTLRENVTSPGGTTAAALSIFMDGKMQDIFDTALIKARDRGEELSGG